jgi:hypothetical protein
MRRPLAPLAAVIRAGADAGVRRCWKNGEATIALAPLIDESAGEHGTEDEMKPHLGWTLAAVAAFAASAAAAEPTVLHIASHLTKPAKATLDTGKPVTVPVDGSTVVAVVAGSHVLKVTAPGVSYHQALDLKTAKLLQWKGKGYWCVNLLENSVEVYSTEDCQEDVEDAG